MLLGGGITDTMRRGDWSARRQHLEGEAFWGIS
jgi:hypothetical protein